jgi:transposase
MAKMDLLSKVDLPLFNSSKHYLGATCKRGHLYEDTGLTVRHKGHKNCVMCCREGALKWAKDNPDRYKANTKKRDLKSPQRQRAWNADNPIASVVLSAKGRHRAKYEESPILIDADYMRKVWYLQGGKCYWTGLELHFYGVERHPLKASLERLDNSVGYLKGNVVWASNFANRARGDLDANEFMEVLATVTESIAGFTSCEIQDPMFIPDITPQYEPQQKKDRFKAINDQEALEVYKLAWSGMAGSKIAEKYGISLTTVSEIKNGRKRAKLTNHVAESHSLGLLAQGKIDLILSMKDSGLSCRDIARIAGCSHHTVSRYLSAYA